MKYSISTTVAFFVLTFATCMTFAKSNTYGKHFMIQPEFFSANIKKITVMPVIDMRRDKSINKRIKFKVNFNYMLRAKGSGELITIKKYDVENYDYADKNKIVELSDLNNPTKKWLQSLGPKESRYMLFFIFSDAHSSLGFGYNASSEVSAYLFDRQTGKLVWRNHYVSQSGQAGVVGLLVGRYHGIRGSLSKAVIGLFKGFPERGISYQTFRSTWRRE